METGDLTHDVTTNNPPEATPFEQVREAISSLELEAKSWFDGTPIENEQQASDVARILDAARKVKKEADAERRAEKEPHDAAAKAVQEKWNPLLGDADRIAECAKKAQTQWLLKLERQKRDEEELARKEAEAKIAEAQRLAAEANGSLEAAKARDDAIEEAKRAQAAAARASHQKASSKGAGMARSVSLRTRWVAKVEDRRALLNHIATNDPKALVEFVEEWAQKMVSAGARALPGVTVAEERTAA